MSDRSDPYPDHLEPDEPVVAADPAEARAALPYDAPEVERMLRQVIDVVEAARPVPLSASSMVNKDELLSVLNDIASRLPDELRAARWLLKEREDFLARVRREGDELMELARARAEQMVQRTEVVKSAESRARMILEQAESRAKRLRLEAEDYCDQKLGSFEAVLERTLNVVTEGRARLQGDPFASLKVEVEDEPAADGEDVPGFYDQDQD